MSINPIERQTYVQSIIDGGVKGYVYAFPDKRLYEHVENPGVFISQAWESYRGPLALYVHVPFCTPKSPPDKVRNVLKENTDNRSLLCGYCNLYTTVRPGVPDKYTDLVLKEIDMYKKLFCNSSLRATSLYFGGGTPSLLRLDDIARVYQGLEKLSGGFPSDMEKAIEFIPDSYDQLDMEGLVQIGFNRVSVGVQTFDPYVLKYTGRNYDPRLAILSIQRARDMGLQVNGDLIAGLPEATEDVFLADVYTMTRLLPDVITIYQGMTRPKTRFGMQASLGILTQAKPEEIYSWIEQANQILEKSGYRRHSLTCWARGEAGYRQGDDTYNRIPLLGVGAGARSYAPNAHYGTPYVVDLRLVNHGIQQWKEALTKGDFPPIEGVIMDQGLKERAAAIFGLMTQKGVTLEEMGHRFDDIIAMLIDQRLVEKDNNANYRYTDIGKTYSGALSTLFYGEEIIERLKEYEIH